MEQLAQSIPGTISLSQGIPSLPSDGRIRENVIKALVTDKVDTYSHPQGMQPLRKLISQKLAEENMVYSSDEIIITAGATEAMTATLLSLLNPYDEVLIPSPTYAAFFKSCETARLNVKTVPLKMEKNWDLPLDSLKKRITSKTKAIILCNPNNPTGSIINLQTLEEICNIAKKRNLFVILDEVYRNMLYNGEKLSTPASNPSYRKHIIRIVSFSKDFSLTGWRIGFLHAEASLIERILPVHDSLVNCAPVISQYAAVAAIIHYDEIVSEHLKVYRENRDIMDKYLSSLRRHLTYSKPDGGYFFFPNVKNCTDSYALCMDILKISRLAVVPGTDFGESGKGHIRLCFGRSREDIIEGMKRFVKYFQTYE